MVLILQKDSDLILCNENQIIKFNTKTNEEQVTVLPPIVIPEGVKKPPANEAAPNITTACVSPDGKYIAVSTQNKQVAIYDICKFEPVKSFVLARVASKLRFTHDNDILVADKTGDAYLYRLTDEENAPTLILGHLSMLLDILLTRCGKYIITCDRDEKIRVSHFPNAYNIVSFCLGHREFVTNIDLIGNDVLVSASGDGTIRFWDFLSGQELHRIRTGEFIEDKKVVDGFCASMDKEKCEVSCLPITNMQVFEGERTYVAVSVLNYVIQIHGVEHASKNAVQTKLLQSIACDSSLIHFSFGQNLFVLLNDGVLWYHEGEGGGFSLVKSDCSLGEFYKRNKVKLKADDVDDVSFLYKRKFDNVQEYLERKKLRLQIK